MTDTRPVVLKAEHLGITFGGLKAVSDFNMEIHEGELMRLIGPNGAGKTTVFNLLTGVYVPTEGAFYLCGQKLNGKQTYQVVEAGIARTFQNIRLFKAMTVLDNVKIAFTKDIHYNLADSLLRTKKYWNTEQELTDKAMEYLRIVHLDDKAGQLASSLPYGQQRKLEIARALATNMKLLLLDEPAAGMNPTETAELLSCINTIRDTFHVAILLIEHDMSLVMRVCERIQVINFGQTIAAGLPSEIASNQEVIEAYLGEERRTTMLKIEDLEVSYGAVQALRGISMEVNDGEIVSLIGANGAGKTTTLHAITGLVPIKSGSVIYDGHDLRKTDPSCIVTMGLAHVPEGRQVFTRMTVAENLAMGAYFRKDKKAIADDLERVYARFPRLKERAKQLAGTLSGGEQQMLAMGRAIMSAPKLIVMDEPSMGLSPVLVQEVFSIIGTMHELGITILLVEQNAKMALAIADRAYVLENGRITMSGGARDLLHDDKVRKAYLGA